MPRVIWPWSSGVLEQIFITVVASLMGGAVTGLATIAALRVDVGWLKMSVIRLEAGVSRAHERIDNIGKSAG